MRGTILFLQIARRASASDTAPLFDQQLGQLSAALREEDYRTSLLRLDHFDRARLRSTVQSVSPDLIFARCEGSSIDLARRVLAELAEPDEHRVPVLFGGSMATVMPDVVLSMPGVQAVFLGEADFSLPAYVEAVLHEGDPTRIEGVWTNLNGKVTRTGIATLVQELDELPYVDRELFGAKPNTDTFDITVGRGCPHRCTYCINDRLRASAEAGQSWVRRRSAEEICGEFDQLCETYPDARLFRFTDHALVDDLPWFRRFAEVYESNCGVPFTCHVRASVLDEERARLLKRAGCIAVEVEVISGSNFVRNEVLDMQTEDGDIRRTFELLHDVGIESHAVGFVGAPYSTPIAESETVELFRRLSPEFVELRVYYPFEGTASRELCREMGWLSNRSEDCYAQSRSVLDMPQLTADQINKLAETMTDDIAGRPSSLMQRWLNKTRLMFGWMMGGFSSSLSGRSAGPMRQRR